MDALVLTLSFSLSILGPIFIVLFLGTYLSKVRILDQAFVETGSKLVFNITLPALLFINISQADFKESANVPLILAGVVVTLVTWLLITALAKKIITSDANRGVVIQGGFRSNMGVFGLAFCFNAYGTQGLVTASLYVATVTILYNVLSIISLNRASKKALGFGGTLIGIIKNPLIMAICAALPFSYFNITLPEFTIKTGQYFANMTLPLALLCIGASLDFKVLRHNIKEAALACSAKLILVPLVMLVIAIPLGFRGQELGVLFFMASAPTATGSYVMVRALGGNSVLAANIIVSSTIFSLITTSLGITILRGLQLI